MGGRGASSYGAVGGGGYMAAAKNANALFVEGRPPIGKEKEAAEIINSYNKVLKDFGMDRGTGFDKGVNSIFFDDETKVSANTNGLGDLTIGNKELANPRKVAEGYFTADSHAGVGAHEAGHRVANLLLRKSMKGEKELKIADARSKGKMEKQIIKEATKRFGSNPSISKYGDKNSLEKVAEAVSDVYTNENKANEYSKVIVNVMKDINNGKFKPRI